MTESNPETKHTQPPRLTVGQALVIFLILIIGFFSLHNGQVLIVLVIAMGITAFILNRLFQFILYLVMRNDTKKP